MNSYPFIENKHKPVFTGELSQIVPPIRQWRTIDITDSPVVPASTLRHKLDLLHRAGELDGGLPVIRNDALVGLIPAPDLEYALDNLPDEASSQCLMAKVMTIEDSDDEELSADPTDLTPYIDPAPLSLDMQSPMDLVYECFVKLGLRYVCVLQDGMYAGLVSLISYRAMRAHFLVGYMRDGKANSDNCRFTRRRLPNICAICLRSRATRAVIY